MNAKPLNPSCLGNQSRPATYIKSINLPESTIKRTIILWQYIIKLIALALKESMHFREIWHSTDRNNRHLANNDFKLIQPLACADKRFEFVSLKIELQQVWRELRTFRKNLRESCA